MCKGKVVWPRFFPGLESYELLHWAQGHKEGSADITSVPLKPVDKDKQVAPLLGDRVSKRGKNLSQGLGGTPLFSALKILRA